MTNSMYWLAASGAFFLVEAFGIPGIGFLFAGLAAVLVAALIELQLVAAHDVVLQFAVFAIFTAASAVLMWRKLKSWRLNPNAPTYSNIIGTEATVIGDGIAGAQLGEVRWSGTHMRARLADPAHSVPAGAIVKVTALDGNVLVVTAK